MPNVKNNLEQKNLRIRDEELEELLKNQRTRILIVGIGGAGNNTVTRLAEAGIQGIEMVAINTDAQDLLFSKATSKLIIGRNLTRGLGAGGDPQIGEQAAKESSEELKLLLQGADLVFVSCGLGGGTGTGSAPIVAEISHNLNALTISVVTVPFSDEGVLKAKNAQSGLDRLRQNSDTVIVIQNDQLLNIVPDLPVNAAFKLADEILINSVRAITSLFLNKGLINLDFADLKAIMKDGGSAMIGIGESESNEKVKEAIEKATRNQLLDIDINGAKKALISIEGDESLSIGEARKIMVSVAEKLDPNAKILWGTSINKDLKGKIRIFVIATGIQLKQEESAAPEKTAEPSSQQKSDGEIGPPEKIASQPQKNKGLAKAVSSALSSKNVFNQIFEDEIAGDLNILKESIKFLDSNKMDTKVLRNLKNACKGLRNSAQLYSKKNFEEFIRFISDIFDQLLADKIRYSPRFLPLFTKIPPVLDGMAAGYAVADEDGRQMIKELSLLLDQSSQETKAERDKATAKKKADDSSSLADDEIIIEKKDLEKKIKLELN